MNRKFTKSLKRRIEQSCSDIAKDVLSCHEKAVEQSSRTALAIAGTNLNILFKRACVALIVVFAALCLSVAFTSCNVTRVVTNESQYFQRGDTAVMITTKTVETYDATKKL